MTEANALRISCSATVDPPRALQLELSAPGLPTRTFATDGDPGAEHSLLGWGLKPNTEYTWGIGDASGQVTTGDLPDALSAAQVVTTGTAWGLDAVLYPLICPDETYFTMIDTDGDIVWYEHSPIYRGDTHAYNWAPDEQSVLSLDGETLLEQHVSGDERMRWVRGVDFDHRLHHDVARWRGYTYLLHDFPVDDVNVDGFDVFEGQDKIGTFSLTDHYEINDERQIDWSHANGLVPNEDGELVLSLFNWDTLIGIDGDPRSDRFLEILWVAAGSDDSLPDPDYVPADANAEFSKQHHASRVGDHLWLYDNTGDGARSRAVRLIVDAEGGQVGMDAEWFQHRRCNIQGGAYPLEGGGVLTTCALDGLVQGFREGATDPEFTLSGTCDGPAAQFIQLTKGIPVRIGATATP